MRHGNRAWTALAVGVLIAAILCMSVVAEETEDEGKTVWELLGEIYMLQAEAEAGVGEALVDGARNVADALMSALSNVGEGLVQQAEAQMALAAVIEEGFTIAVDGTIAGVTIAGQEIRDFISGNHIIFGGDLSISNGPPLFATIEKSEEGYEQAERVAEVLMDGAVNVTSNAAVLTRDKRVAALAFTLRMNEILMENAEDPFSSSEFWWELGKTGLNQVLEDYGLKPVADAVDFATHAIEGATEAVLETMEDGETGEPCTCSESDEDCECEKADMPSNGGGGSGGSGGQKKGKSYSVGGKGAQQKGSGGSGGGKPLLLTPKSASSKAFSTLAASSSADKTTTKAVAKTTAAPVAKAASGKAGLALKAGAAGKQEFVPDFQLPTAVSAVKEASLKQVVQPKIETTKKPTPKPAVKKPAAKKPAPKKPVVKKTPKKSTANSTSRWLKNRSKLSSGTSGSKTSKSKSKSSSRYSSSSSRTSKSSSSRSRRSSSSYQRSGSSVTRNRRAQFCM